MFDIRLNEAGDVVLSGRFDGAQVDKAKAVFDQVASSTSVDFKELAYISSAGLGILMATQKRLKDNGHKLKLKNVSGHIRDVFRIARFDLVFDLE
jgi:anti-sigma B factor antagonist